MIVGRGEVNKEKEKEKKSSGIFRFFLQFLPQIYRVTLGKLLELLASHSPILSVRYLAIGKFSCGHEVC